MADTTGAGHRSSALVLDSEALSMVVRADTIRPTADLRAAIKAAFEARSEVVVPAAVLAELYRCGVHDKMLDSYLGRRRAMAVADTDRPLARRIGHVLARAGRGSQDHVDASVVAVAEQFRLSVILAGDLADLTVLAASSPGVTVSSL